MNQESLENKFEKAFKEAGKQPTGLGSTIKRELTGIVETMLTGSSTEYPETGTNKIVPVVINTAPDRSLTQKCIASSGAAALSAVMCGSANTLGYIEGVKTGEMGIKDATVKILGEVIASAADSAIKASGETIRGSLKERFGSENGVLQFIAQQGIKTVCGKFNLPAVATNTVTVAVSDLISLGIGKMTPDEYAKRCGGLIKSLAGTVTNGLGISGGMGAANTFIGKQGLKILFQNVARSSGILIAALGMAFAVKLGIERPYRDLLHNTQTVKDAATELEQISKNIFKNQVLFTKCLELDVQLERQIQSQMGKIDVAGSNALNAILDI